MKRRDGSRGSPREGAHFPDITPLPPDTPPVPMLIPPAAQPTAVEIRQAVAFGKQAVIRELVDALEAEYRKSSVLCDQGWQNGFHNALWIVKRHQIEGEPRR